MLLKSTLRTIKKSLGRYLAILSIIALGVGFFAGLRVTEKAMLKTADGYIEGLSLYDLRLVSTLGLTGDDVKAFASLDGVTAAEGAFGADMLVSYPGDGSDYVLTARTLTGSVNGIDLLEGRLPERTDECLIDAKVSSSFGPGDRIVISENCPEKNAENFTCREYLVTGVCNSSEYISYQRGTTTLPGGTVNGFVYLLPDGYSGDIYTDVYLKVRTDGMIYSDEYLAAIDAVRPDVEAMLGKRAEMRYDSLRSEAAAKLDEARAELDGKKADLEEAKRSLAEGRESYLAFRAESESALENARASLEAKRAELDAGWEELNAAKNGPFASVPAVAEQIARSEAELTAYEEVYAAALDEYGSSLRTASAAWEETERTLSSLEAEIAEGEEALGEAEAELDEGYAALEELERPNFFVLDRSSNPGYANLKNDVAIVSGVAKVFPLFFFLVAALVCVTTMTRMVSEQRTQNGLLKALGYGSTAICSQYLLYAGSASVLGCVSGFLIGSRFMPLALWEVYGILYQIDRPIAFVLDTGLFAVCASLYLIAVLGVTYAVCRRDLGECSAQLMRPRTPAAGKQIFLERLGFIWRRMSFLHKVSARNILRYKKRMFMMVTGIGGCTALLLTGFGIRDTIRPIVDRQYGEISLYDATVTFLHTSDDTERSGFLEETSAVSLKTAFVFSGYSDVRTKDDGTVSLPLVSYAEAPDGFIDLHKGKKEIAWPGNNEAVIDYRSADLYGISEGDVITLVSDDLRETPVTVTGIYDNYIFGSIYINRATYESYSGHLPEANTAYVIFRDGCDPHEAGAVLLGADGVASVSIAEDLKETIGNMLGSLDYIVLIVLVCAGALAFIVLYNLTNITVTERTREIATLRVLGFYSKEQRSYVFRENVILTLIGALFGTPLGIALLRYTLGQIKIDRFYFGCRLSPMSYLISVALTLFFTVAVNSLLAYKILRINMAEAMKATE